MDFLMFSWVIEKDQLHEMGHIASYYDIIFLNFFNIQSPTLLFTEVRRCSSKYVILKISSPSQKPGLN